LPWFEDTSCSNAEHMVLIRRFRIFRKIRSNSNAFLVIYVVVKADNLRQKPSAKSKKVDRGEIDAGLKVTGSQISDNPFTPLF
jgi:hypothetical protein